MRKILISTILLCITIVCHAQTRLIDSLLQVIAKHTRDTNEIKALDHLSTEFMRNDIEKAKYYAYLQIALAKSLGTHFGLSEAYAGLTLMHQDLGHMDSARYYLGQLEMLAKKFPSDKKATTSYFNTA